MKLILFRDVINQLKSAICIIEVDYLQVVTVTGRVTSVY